MAFRKQTIESRIKGLTPGENKVRLSGMLYCLEVMVSCIEQNKPKLIPEWANALMQKAQYYVDGTDEDFDVPGLLNSLPGESEGKQSND